MNESEATGAGALRPIPHRYLLVLHIPVYLDQDGARWTDPLWGKDLLRHVDYLADFTLACPCIVGPPPGGFMRVDDGRIRFVDLPSRHKSTLRLPTMVAQLWRSIRRAEVVHTGLGGWLPVSICNLTSLFAILHRRFLFIIVESSPWRLVPGQSASIVERVKARLAEWVNRLCLTRVNLAIFTHAQYRQSLMPKPKSTQSAHVIHATWIDADDVLSDEEVASAWSAKRAANVPRLAVLFAGRLTAAKGVPVLLEALRRLEQRVRNVEVTIVGSGELLDACRDAARSLRYVCLNVLEPVAYGPEFLRLVRRHDAVVVPSVTDEQPRIVYDAFSQAVPVLGSDTDGLRECVGDGHCGHLCRANDPEALCDLLDQVALNAGQLETLGLAGLQKARGMTHQEMHRLRWALLQTHLPLRRVRDVIWQP